MITTSLFRLGLPALALAATAALMTDTTATAQPLPTYTCKYTLAEPHLGSVKGRECTASAGAPLSGWHLITFRMENSETGEKWVCGNVEAALIPYYFERAYGRGADASICDRIMD
jgi:hypothetical protein